MCWLLHPSERGGLTQHRLISNKPTVPKGWWTSSWKHMTVQWLQRRLSFPLVGWGLFPFLFPFPHFSFLSLYSFLSVFFFFFFFIFLFLSSFALSFWAPWRNADFCSGQFDLQHSACLFVLARWLSNCITERKNNGRDPRHQLRQQLCAGSLAHSIFLDKLAWNKGNQRKQTNKNPPTC